MSSIVVLRNLESSLRIGAAVSAGGLLVSAISFLADKMRKSDKRQHIRSANKPADVQTLMHLIHAYLDKKNTTAFLKKSVSTLGKQVSVTQNRVDTVTSMVQQRFSNNVIGHDQYAAPVQFLFENLINLGIDLMRRLDKFDALYYQKKIDEGTSPRGHGASTVGVSEYQEIMDTYVRLVASVVDSFENASLKLDRLIIEIGDISSDELVRSTASMQELDSCIAAMKELENRIVLELTEE